MLKNLYLPYLLMVLLACQEPISFEVNENIRFLTVEGYISDLSYEDINATGSSPGRFFKVLLQYSRPINRFEKEHAKGASVSLVVNDSASYDYTEGEDGVYSLLMPSFKAQEGHSYQLRIQTSDDELFYSDVVSLPSETSNVQGEISFEDGIIRKYEYSTRNRTIEEIEVKNFLISLNAESATNAFYKWSFIPSWQYVAVMAPLNSPVRTCWVTSKNYLNHFILAQQSSTQQSIPLFSVDLKGNDKLLYDMTVLVSQQLLNEDHFRYFEELDAQTKRGSIFDPPPFNVRSNINSEEGNPVIGYFGVSREELQRLYFSHDSFGYIDRGDYYKVCEPGPGPMPQECIDCTAFRNGDPVNQKPDWWR